MHKYSSIILPTVSSIGVVATVASAIKATPTAIKLIEEDRLRNESEAYTNKDALRSCWKCYIPSAVIGAATITCIFGTAILNNKQQASLISAYTLASKSFDQYKDKVKELLGEEAHEQVMEAIALEKCKDTYVYAPTIVGEQCLSPDKNNYSECIFTFYDSIGERYFETSIQQVLEAEYHLNRNFCLRGSATVNEFYDFLGLKGIDKGDILGWDINDEYFWIDFNHIETTIDDGTTDGAEVVIIDVLNQPRIILE